MNDQLQQQLQVLNRLYKESDHIYSRLASKLGITDTTFWVLYAIAHSEEPMTQNDVCSDFFFPVQTIHSAINKADEIEKNAFLRFGEEERELYLSLFRRHIDYLKGEEKRVLDSISEQGGKPE